MYSAGEYSTFCAINTTKTTHIHTHLSFFRDWVFMMDLMCVPSDTAHSFKGHVISDVIYLIAMHAEWLVGKRQSFSSVGVVTTDAGHGRHHLTIHTTAEHTHTHCHCTIITKTICLHFSAYTILSFVFTFNVILSLVPVRHAKRFMKANKIWHLINGTCVWHSHNSTLLFSHTKYIVHTLKSSLSPSRSH